MHLHINLPIRLSVNHTKTFLKGMEGVITKVREEDGVFDVYFECVDKYRVLRFKDRDEKWEVVEMDETQLSHMEPDDYRSLYDVALMTGDEEWFYEIGQLVRGGIACDFEASCE